MKRSAEHMRLQRYWPEIFPSIAFVREIKIERRFYLKQLSI